MNEFVLVLIIYSLFSGIFLTYISKILFFQIQNSYYRISSILNIKFLTTNKNILIKLFVCLILCFSFMMLINFYIFSNFKNVYYYLYVFLVYFLMAVMFVILTKQQYKNIKLKYTKKMIRLVLFSFLLNFIFCYLILKYFYLNTLIIKLAVVSFCAIFCYLTIIISVFLNMPIDLLTYKYYLIKARRKLKNCYNLKVIGITGSYGKTSTKNILATILSEKYSVCFSPHNYNTNWGVLRTINENLKPINDVLILEMGADKKDDIKKICSIIKPNVGILTGVGNCHLKTFKTKRNLIQTKYQIVENSTDFAVFNGECNISKKLYFQTKLKKFIVGFVPLKNKIKNCVTAENVKINNNALSFDICGLFNKNFNVNVKLLGKHNILNILQACVVAKEMGLTKEEIKSALLKIKPTKNRLELIKVNDNLSIINDSYNANIIGAKNALETLKNFKEYKICVTPGFVELGDLQYKENYEFAKCISRVADLVIVVKNENKESLIEGLKENKNVKVVCVSSFQSAMNYINKIKKNKIVLIENDLPEIYKWGVECWMF